MPEMQPAHLLLALFQAAQDPESGSLHVPQDISHRVLQCDGERPKWQDVQGLAEISPSTLSRDRSFLEDMQSLLEARSSTHTRVADEPLALVEDLDRLEATQRGLLNHCLRRRVWLHFSRDPSEGDFPGGK